VYSGSYDDTVKAVDASDGSEIWSHSLHSSNVNSVHASNGVVYSGSYRLYSEGSRCQ
ncbi:PQQ-binding-like beta-propeller repeat protein, partial [Nanohaloarchaea archaeon H12]|nr:PQQ-binding-like beta-propeller repeat protein [Nanohaloarchaea archaeon H12]